MNDETHWRDPQGRLVPVSQISAADQMKDELVTRLCEEAERRRDDLAAFKRRALDEVMAAKALIFEKYGAKIGGPKGNFALRRYDGSSEVEYTIADRIVFGPELQAAKALIDECIQSWDDASTLDPRFKILIDDTFQVNKAGRIDTHRVLGLRKHKMIDPVTGEPDALWERAMEAVTDALIVDRTAIYLRFYRRDPRTNRREQIALSFAEL